MRYVSFFFLLMLLFSCNPSAEKKSRKVGKAQSAPYELLVVADKDWLKTSAGQMLVSLVEQPIPGLPQAEPHFRVTYIYPNDFAGTFRTYSNVLVVEIGQKHTKPQMTLDRDVFARPQVVIGLYAPNDQALLSLIQAREKDILAQFNEQEFSRERALLGKTYSDAVLQQARKQFGISIHVPKDIADMKIAKDFLWAAASERDFRQNLCLYSFPLAKISAFETIRDSMLRVNIPGGKEGQWMETDHRTVILDEINDLNSHVAQTENRGARNDKKFPNRLIMRGLWDMRNDAMGGPFVSYLYVDTLRQRCIVAEAFVFAPNQNKRALIKQMEAALQTVTFESEK